MQKKIHVDTNAVTISNGKFSFYDNFLLFFNKFINLI